MGNGYWFFDCNHTTRIDGSTVTCPALIIAGAQDRITPVSVVDQVYKKYKAVATNRVFKDHAHWVVAEPGWEDVGNAVLIWLNDRLT